MAWSHLLHLHIDDPSLQLDRPGRRITGLARDCGEYVCAFENVYAGETHGGVLSVQHQHVRKIPEQE